MCTTKLNQTFEYKDLEHLLVLQDKVRVYMSTIYNQVSSVINNSGILRIVILSFPHKKKNNNNNNDKTDYGDNNNNNIIKDLKFTTCTCILSMTCSIRHCL